jgi:NADP-dependent 3-hydroxy acid dehydrogenase YdfG
LSPGETKTGICNNETITGDVHDYYKLNPALEPANVAEGVKFILSLSYDVNVSELTMRCIGARV